MARALFALHETITREFFRNRPHLSHQPDAKIDFESAALQRGDEFGRFNMGSTVIFVASSGLLEWDSAKVSGQTVLVNESIGKLKH